MRHSFPWRTLLLVTLLHGGLVLGTALKQRGPGYMDAAYYAVLGRRLAQGLGLTEPFLWTYLDEPPPPPRPGPTYWMPLASFLAALGTKGSFGPSEPYAQVRAPFFLLALLLPGATGLLAHRLVGRASTTRWAMLLSTASGFFLPYLPAVDAFTPLMLLGTGYFLLVPASLRNPKAAFALGLVTGFIHLARNEGPIWLFLALFLMVSVHPPSSRRWRLVGSLLLGNLVIMGPWWLRNVQVLGTPWPSSSLRLLWLTHYNDLFLYPPQALTFARWWKAGPETWISARLQALTWNLQTLLAVQAGIAGFPWLLWGWWRTRHDLRVRAATGLWLALFTLMTLVFPAPGSRGGFFHSIAGLQPLVWTLTACGLEAFFEWGRQRRGWHPLQVRIVLGGGLWLLLLGLTAGIAYRRLETWNTSSDTYTQLAHYLAQRVSDDCPILVNDPPMWAWATQGEWLALVVPSGGREAVVQVARKYQACTLLLEPNHPPELTSWYTEPRSWGAFEYVGTWQDIHVFRINP